MKLVIHAFMLFLICNTFSVESFARKSKGMNIVGEEVSYMANGITMKEYIAYDKSQKGKRPNVLVVHEWWGCNEYAKKRARMLAGLGYIAMAVDLYGNGKIATDPTTAQQYATAYYQNPVLARELLEAARFTMKNYAQTDENKIAAIGYCFGGGVLLNMARMGMDFKGIVSFHGSLNGTPAAAGTVNTQILVCHGEADVFVKPEEVIAFQQSLKAANIPYEFISYPDATHAFTNPDATATGKQFDMPIEYNEAADKKSWNDMAVFLKKVFAVSVKTVIVE